MIVDKVETNTIPVWKAEIIERENIKELLDKIRTEIDLMPSELDEYGRRMIRRESVFRIIDKYKNEMVK